MTLLLERADRVILLDELEERVTLGLRDCEYDARALAVTDEEAVKDIDNALLRVVFAVGFAF